MYIAAGLLLLMFAVCSVIMTGDFVIAFPIIVCAVMCFLVDEKKEKK